MTSAQGAFLTSVFWVSNNRTVIGRRQHYIPSRMFVSRRLSIACLFSMFLPSYRNTSGSMGKLREMGEDLHRYFEYKHCTTVFVSCSLFSLVLRRIIHVTSFPGSLFLPSSRPEEERPWERGCNSCPGLFYNYTHLFQLFLFLRAFRLYKSNHGYFFLL